MLTVQDDWIQYEETPVRRVAVRGGATCAQRIPVVRALPAPRRPVLAPVGRTPHRSEAGGAGARPRAAAAAPGARPRRLRLTRRGRLVLIVLPGLLAVSGAAVTVSGATTPQAAPAAAVVTAPEVLGR